MKFEFNFTKEEVEMAKFTEVNPHLFKVELFLNKDHFVNVVAKFVECVQKDAKK